MYTVAERASNAGTGLLFIFCCCFFTALIWQKTKRLTSWAQNHVKWYLLLGSQQKSFESEVFSRLSASSALQFFCGCTVSLTSWRVVSETTRWSFEIKRLGAVKNSWADNCRWQDPFDKELRPSLLRFGERRHHLNRASMSWWQMLLQMLPRKRSSSRQIGYRHWENPNKSADHLPSNKQAARINLLQVLTTFSSIPCLLFCAVTVTLQLFKFMTTRTSVKTDGASLVEIYHSAWQCNQAVLIWGLWD